ncbi:MAG: desulfoferrodoxin [Acidobacteria bacterium]|nr:desulfoferrodoxin [Acidobacteriota bacterium]
MPDKKDIYKSLKTGMIVEVLHAGDGELKIGGEKLKHFKENTVDAAVEKHIPMIEKIEGGYKVIVGEVQHPMEETHWIEWIELEADGKSYRQFLNPGDKPEAVFMIEAKKVKAREFCNLHGLWIAQN